MLYRRCATRPIGSLRERKNPARTFPLALPLLMPGIRRADDVNDAAPPHDFAVLTNLLYRRTNFHFLLPMPRRLAFFIRPSYWCDIMCEDACATKSMTPTTIINNDVPPNWNGMAGFTMRMISGSRHTAMMYRSE